MRICETERLVLRHIHILDAEPLMAVFGDPTVMRFGDGPQSAEWVRGWVRSCLARYHGEWGFGPYAVVERAGRALIGYCGLFYYPDLGGRAEVEVGYRLARAAWGRGYATEAARAVRDYAFATLGLARLVALIDPGNAPSLRVAAKLGMAYEREIMLEGYTHPDHLYAMGAPGVGPDGAA